MLRIVAVVATLALLPWATAEPQEMHLSPDGRLAAHPETGLVPLVGQGGQDPLLEWRSGPLPATHLDGPANVTLHLEGAGGPFFASLMAVSPNATRVLSAGQFGASGPLAQMVLSLDVTGKQIHAGEQLVLVLRIAEPAGAAILTGPDTPSRITLPVAEAPVPVETPAPPPEPDAGPTEEPAAGEQAPGPDARRLARPAVAWILAIAMGAVSLALAARGTGRW